MNLKIAGLVTLCLALALPAVGQIQRGRGFGPEGGRAARPFDGPGNPLGRLQRALDLTAAQTASFEPLLAAYRENVRNLGGQLRTARETARNLVEAGDDPAAIGNAVLAERALLQQLGGLNERLLEDFRNLLTTNQRERLDSILAMGRGGGFGMFGPGPQGGRGGRPPVR